jgi:hypothetical protein
MRSESANLRRLASPSRMVIGHEEDGEEISTSGVQTVEFAEPKADAPRANILLRSQALRIEALTEAGETIRPLGVSGPPVRVVDDNEMRQRSDDLRRAERCDRRKFRQAR